MNQFTDTNASAVSFQQPAVKSARTYDVLAVDDYPDTLLVVNRFLEKAGLTCLAVDSGRKALEQINSGNIPGLVLLDIMMQDISGYEVLKTLRKTFAPTDLPVIMLTGRTDVQSLVESYRNGANDYISKPFSHDELIARVQCHLDLQKAHETFQKNLLLQKELLEQKQKKADARRAAKKQEREKLRYQINPHFLFNSLASIRGAVFSAPEAAHKMITHLAEFCRLSLSRATKTTQTIERELCVVEHYLAMEKLRFGDYLCVEIALDPALADVVIPSLILQPLVENAVKYGTKASPDHLGIRIIVDPLPDHNISITVSNNGHWISMDSKKSTESTGIGLKNVKDRLSAFYGDRFTFQKHEKDDRVNIHISIPDRLSS
jgi:sensor histidine kinase YesM